MAILAYSLLQAAEAPSGSILTPNAGLMIWTLAIFLTLMFVLARFAFKPITRAVEQREQALEAALSQATKDREEAARILAEHRELLEKAHGEGARLVAEARAGAERVRSDLVAKAHGEQQEMLRRAREEIDGERKRAIADLRRETIDLAIRAAGVVVQQNLDDRTNRALVERFLATVPAPATTERTA